MRLFFILLISYCSAYGQYNCDVFLTEGDTCKYKACNYLENVKKPFQLTKKYHDIYNKALEICPEYDLAYRNKSTAYLKTGDFIMWKKLIDKAVALNPEEHLFYRGWCRFQFFNDYEGAIKDIEELERISKYDIGYSQNGTYHLKIAKALCYKMLGKRVKAINIIKDYINENPNSRDLYDYYHLGVLYFETQQLQKAKTCFIKQLEEYDFAGNRYYLGLTKKDLGDNFLNELNTAKALYEDHRIMFDPYSHQVDKVYYEDIEMAIERFSN